MLCIFVFVAAVAAPENIAPSSQPAAIERVNFKDALDRAFQRNVTVRQAAADIDRVYGLLRELRAPALPTLTANASYTRLDSARSLNGVVLLPENQVILSGTLALPLLAPSRWATWSHAHEQVDAAKWNFEDLRRQTAIAVAHAYVSTITQHHLLEVSRLSYNNAEGHAKYAEARFSGGKGNRLDAIRAEQELQTSAQQIEEQMEALDKAQEALGVLLGAEAPIDAAEVPDLPIPASEKSAEDHRQDVKHQEVSSNAAKHVARDWWTDLLPVLVASFTPFYADPPTTQEPHTGWQAVLALTWNLYDGGLRYGFRQEHIAEAKEAALQLEGVLRQARSEIRTAVEEVRRADAALQRARSASQLAQQALDLSTIAYKAGAIDNLAVIDAERAARDAETSAAEADDASMQARVDLLAATGHFP